MVENFTTEHDIRSVVRLSLGNDVHILNYCEQIFTEEQLGFLGAYRHLVITVKRKNSTAVESHTFFLKSMPRNIAEQTAIIVESKAFYKEANFYRLILPKLLREVKDNSWVAQCYLAKEDLLIFENLQSKNFAIKGKLLDEIDIKSGLSSFAKLHAASILAEKRMGKTFIEVYPELLKESLFTKNNKFYEWILKSIDVNVAVADYLGLESKSIPDICHRIMDMMLTSRTRQNVISHGDPKSLNVMFDNSKPLPNSVLVDFQLVRYVPAMRDVSQFLYLNTRRSIREHIEQKVLKHYHEIFSQVLKDGDCLIEISSYEEILKEYEESRLVGLVTASMYSPINFIEGKECAEMVKDSVGFSQILLGDRQDQVLKMMQKNILYKDIISEIMMEMSERSSQLLKLELQK